MQPVCTLRNVPQQQQQLQQQQQQQQQQQHEGIGGNNNDKRSSLIRLHRPRCKEGSLILCCKLQHQLRLNSSSGAQSKAING